MNGNILLMSHIYLFIYKVYLKKYLTLKGERDYLHSTSIVKSLDFLSKFIKINRIQFNQYLKYKPNIYISSYENYIKSKNIFIEIEIQNKKKYIIYMKPSNKIFSKSNPYFENINHYTLNGENMIFKKSNNLNMFESIIAGNKIFCNKIIESEANWAAVRISFNNYYLLENEFQEITISNFKVIQNLWFENIVYIGDEILCSILFKKE